MKSSDVATKLRCQSGPLPLPLPLALPDIAMHQPLHEPQT
jgi:hypothetical protein